MRHVQHPVRDLGGNRVLGGTVGIVNPPPLPELVESGVLSFGAMGGRRGCLLEESPRLVSSCITVRHMVLDIDGANDVGWSVHVAMSVISRSRFNGQAVFNIVSPAVIIVINQEVLEPDGKAQVDLAQIMSSLLNSRLVLRILVDISDDKKEEYTNGGKQNVQG